MSVYNKDGTLNPSVATCSAAKAYMDSISTNCISCGFDSKMFYDTVVSACRCSGNFVMIGDTCYAYKANFTRNFTYTTANAFNYVSE